MLFTLPLLCLLASLDEASGIREWLGHRSDHLLPERTQTGTLVSKTGIWMLLLAPVVALGATFLWRALAPLVRDRPRIARLYVAGFCVYAGSALGLELLSNVVPPTSTAAMIQLAGEEGGEMVGVTLLIWATLELLGSWGMRVGWGEAVKGGGA